MDMEPYANQHYHSYSDAVETPDYIDYAYATKITGAIAGYLGESAGILGTVDTLTASVEGNQLRIDYDPNRSGGAVVTVRATDAEGLFALDSFSITVNPGPVVPAVVGRHVFYNGSYWDNKDPGANAADDNAIAPDKVALLPGQTATFSNYSSYNRGLNGIMIDVEGLPAASLTAADFAFRYGNNNTPENWATAPDPTSITVRPGAGADGSDRITLIWPDNAIPDRNWLQVTLKADAQTGLAQDDVFYLGLAIGETGDSTAHAMVSSYDVIRTRDNVRGFLIAAKENAFDFDRSGKVDSYDVILCRDHVSGFRYLSLIAPPGNTGAGAMALSATACLASLPNPTSTASLARVVGRSTAYRDAAFAQDTVQANEEFLFELAQAMELQRLQARSPSTKRPSALFGALAEPLLES